MLKFKTTILLILSITSILTLSSCGKKSALYVPTEQQQKQLQLKKQQQQTVLKKREQAKQQKKQQNLQGTP